MIANMERRERYKQRERERDWDEEGKGKRLMKCEVKKEGEKMKIEKMRRKRGFKWTKGDGTNMKSISCMICKMSFFPHPL